MIFSGGRSIYRKFVMIVITPLFVLRFLEHARKSEYDITGKNALVIILKTYLNTRQVPAYTGFLEQLVLMICVLEVPPKVNGCIVECGSYEGGCSVNLSLLCAEIDREIHLFDSFAGLPNEARSTFVNSTVPLRTDERTFIQGNFETNHERIHTNLQNYGRTDVCQVHHGEFRETLEAFDEQCVLVFADVDLRSSLETCIEHLWSLLQEGGYFFTHESHHYAIYSLFHDISWWSQHLNRTPPTLFGTGTGLGIYPYSGSFGSQLGFATKGNESVNGIDTRVTQSVRGNQSSRTEKGQAND